MEFGISKSYKLLEKSVLGDCTLWHRLKLVVSSCVLCGASCKTHPLICHNCQVDLPVFTLTNVEHNLLEWPAINTLFSKTYFDNLRCVAPYIWPFSHWIGQFKYHGRTELAGLFSYLLALKWQAGNTQHFKTSNTLMICVPLHIKKWQQRGFNQAHLIAKQFAKVVGVNYQPNALLRMSHVSSQVGKSGAERRKSLKNAFIINKELDINWPKHVILFDDVVTTGATANEISQQLKKIGVQEITLLSICLSLPT
jgi:ComF family protein